MSSQTLFGIHRFRIVVRNDKEFEMNFRRDLLLIDLETTGLDAKHHEIIQLAAVLLDKKTLKEKKSFNSYVKPLHWQNRNRESMDINRITWERLKAAPSLSKVLHKLARTFPLYQVVFAYYVGVTDVVFMLEAYKKAKMKWPFDYHTFNIWGLFYAYFAKKNLLKNNKRFAGFGMEDCLKYFKIPSPPLHDALVDCRAEAEVLRRIMRNLK